MVHVPHRNCAAIKLLLNLASSYLLKIILSHTRILLTLCVVFRNFQWCAESPSESTEKKQHFKDIIWSWDGEGNRNGSCQGEAVSKGISISCWFCSVSFINTCKIICRCMQFMCAQLYRHSTTCMIPTIRQSYGCCWASRTLLPTYLNHNT